MPREVHRRLKARAAMEGMTMSDFVLREVVKALERPTRQELLDRIHAQAPKRLRRAPADVIRGERNGR